MPSIYQPSLLRALLQELGMKPNAALGQNFLIDGNILAKIVKEAHITPVDNLLEIGPGAGALTEFLLETGASVTAVEKDLLFADYLEKKFPSLHVIKGDFLKISFPKGVTKVVANLPYYITTDIIEKLIIEGKNIESMTLMMQKEVGERLFATVGNKKYGTLALFIQTFGSAKKLFNVKPTCFYPKPKVDSIVVQLTRREKPLLEEVAPFFQFIQELFSKRRKMALGSKRCEELTLDQIVALFLENSPAATTRRTIP